tara:strand:+ start:1756 stop:2502 length:747 start_codon:yes stop_codon:yes gene_type:complete
VRSYLYQPPDAASGDEMGDGTGMKTHFGSHMCFPMIPFKPKRTASFAELTGIPEEYDWSALEYENACNSDAVKALIGPMTGGLTAAWFISAPYGSMLRLAEGVDSIRNLAGTTLNESYTVDQRAASIACGFAQFGGVLWIAVTMLLCGCFAMCSGVCNVCCIRAVRFCRSGQSRLDERSQAIDELLLANVKTGALADPKGVVKHLFTPEAKQRRMRHRLGRQHRMPTLAVRTARNPDVSFKFSPLERL